MITLTAIRAALLRPRYLGKKPTRRQRRKRQRGIALVMVMIAVAITLVITNQFGTATNVDMLAASNYRDQMRAHFLSRSALDLAELVIRLQQRIDNLAPGTQITDFADQVMLAFCGSPEEVKDAVGFSPGAVKGLGADIGQCGINGAVQTEDNKINLNCANGNTATAASLKAELDALILFPAYDPIFEEADAENYRRDRATQAAAIVDYIDADGLRVRDRGTTEDYGYESLKDRYYAKNNYIDTVGELRLVRGVDDRFWTMFGSVFTVYGGCKTNLQTLTDTQLIAAILFLTAKNPNDPILSNPQLLFQLAGLISKAKQYGETFDKPADFVAYVKDPGGSVGALASKSGTISGSAASAALTNGIPGLAGGQKLGMELDVAKLSQIATTGPRRVYRIESWGQIDRAQKNADGSPVFPSIRSTITGVWDTKVVPQNARKPPVPNGAWVFMKEE